MKWYACLAICVMGTVALQASAEAADRSPENFDALLVQISKVSSTASQSAYSRELQKSVNADAVRRVEQACARKHHASVKTFSLLGIMRLDGMLKAPVPLPDNAFTACVADQIASVTFPLPPGKGNGWPVAMQFDGKSGRVLYMAGDRQRSMYLPRQRATAARKWVYTPAPRIPANRHQACEMSVWVTVGVHGRVQEVDKGNSSCSPVVGRYVTEAAHQWINANMHGAAESEPRDLRISFSVGKRRVRVKL
ncbi:hypothetical protein [Oleiagrimonas sp. MCCC 1A03011]|uniref:hypothetical protein n=1 Tax=Oleiagrimonas sp. MCCC 1A03011 TaxID=1926883 RepID=UPI000DD999E7|nr:hypothetical protein [Oleiagrimonas sp. MCCC 1A03011]